MLGENSKWIFKLEKDDLHASIVYVGACNFKQRYVIFFGKYYRSMYFMFATYSTIYVPYFGNLFL